MFSSGTVTEVLLQEVLSVLFGFSVAWAWQVTFIKLSNYLTVYSLEEGRYAEVNLSCKYQILTTVILCHHYKTPVSQAQ